MGRKLVLKRILTALITLLLVTFMSFLLVQLSPVDPAESYIRMHGSNPTDEAIEVISKSMGLDKPLIIQYLLWMKNACTLNLGCSLVTGNLVTAEFKAAVPKTLAMVLESMIIQIISILVLGSLMQIIRQKIISRILETLCIVCLSIPLFLVGTFVIEIFAMKLNLISVLNSGRFWPALCLALPYSALYSNMLKTNLDYQMKTEWAVYARCRGFSEKRILFFHAMRHSVVELLPSFAQNVGMLIAYSGIIETVFSYKGVGNLIIEAVIHRDLPMIHASVLFLAVNILIINLISERCKIFISKAEGI
jgi:peptide/nickel transport system permease protein